MRLIKVFVFFFVAAAQAAEPPVDQIVVTGDLRHTPLDELPASVSVVGGEEIDARGAHHLEDILGLTANLNVAGGSSRSHFFQIRGIGEQGQFIEPLNPSVGLLIDGVDLSNAAAAATLFDVEQVEVFRGPQGTRYGANALAGLINVTTRQPTDTFQSNASLSTGNYDTWTLRGAVSGPLSERISVRFAGQQHSSDGFFRNGFLDRDDTDKRDERSFRGKLHWRAGFNTTVDAMLGYVNLDNGYDAFSLDNSRTTLSDEPGRDAQKTVFSSTQLTWNGAQSFAVEASAGLAVSDSIYGYDEDWTFVGFDPDGYSSIDYYFRDRRTLSGEVKLLSKDPVRVLGFASDWVVGLYGLRSSEDLRREYTFFAEPFRSAFDVDRAAVFGELKTALGRNTLTSGMRYERHDSAYDDSNAVTFSPGDDLFGWRIGLNRPLRDALMGYGSVARGYKAGGFNTNGTLDADLRQYDPETLMNYELGLKGSFLERRLDARLTAFYMQRHDVQIASSITRMRSDGSSEFIEFIGNAAQGMNAGLEAELDFEATDSLHLQASLGVLRSRYESFVNAAGENLDGRAQAHAPGYQFAVRGRYALSTHWYAELGAEGRDAFFFSDSNNIRSKPYELFDATLGFASGAWNAKVWVRNLGNQDYFIRGYFFGNDPRIGYAERSYAQHGDPRQTGITFSYSFR